MATYEDRPYQIEALDASARAFFSPTQIYRQLIQLPTGTGKTVVIAKLPTGPLGMWLKQYPVTHQKILMLAHREELLDQAADKLAVANPDLRIDIEQAGRKASPMTDVVIASVQTLAARGGKRLQRLDPEMFRVVVVDECHHATAPSYRTVLEHFKFLPTDRFMPAQKVFKTAEQALLWQRKRVQAWDAQTTPSERLLLGITATPKRGDNVGLEAVFQSVVYSRSIQDMIRQGYLSRLRAIRVESEVELDDVRVRAGDLAIDELDHAVDTLARNQLAVRAYKEHADGRRAVVFCVSVEHAQHMARAFTEAGVRSEAIHGNLKTEERADILKRFREGAFRVITNCQILTEGWDDPGVSCIIHARPTKSTLLYIQMTGRGTRIAPKKDDCLIIDIADVTARHTLVTLPTLFGLPVDFDPEGQDILEVDPDKDVKRRTHYFDAKAVKGITLTVQDVDLFGEDDPYVQKAKMPWAKMGFGYTLPIPNTQSDKAESRYIEAMPQPDSSWLVTLHHSNMPSALVGMADNVAEALALGEGYVKRNMDPNDVALCDKSKRWRSDPMTDGQAYAIKRRGGHVLEGLTKGQAAMLIHMLGVKQHKQSLGAMHA